MRRDISLSCFAIGITILLKAGAAQAETHWAGVAVKNITPCTIPFETSGQLGCTSPNSGIRITSTSPPLYIMGTAIGVGQRVERPLSVRALVVTDSLGHDWKVRGHRMVLVSVDSAALDPEFAEEVRKRVGLSRGLAPEEVLINATHTHSAPVMRQWFNYYQPPEGNGDEYAIPQYMQGLVQRTAQAIEAAFDSMQPATLSIGTGTTYACGYRKRDNPCQPQLPEQRSPACDSLNVVNSSQTDKDHPLGPSFDPRVDTIKVDSPGGQRLATAVFAGCHPINMMWQHGFSPDFPGALRDGLEGTEGGTGLFFQGFGGDSNPANFWAGQHASEKGQTTPEDPIKLATLRGNMNMTAAILMADALAPEVQFLPIEGVIKAASRRIYMDECRDVFPGSTQCNKTGYALPVEVQLFTFGSQWALAASAHEVVSEYAPMVRAWLPGFSRGVTIAGYSNGVGNYFPTRRMLDNVDAASGSKGGYERIAERIYNRTGFQDWQDLDFIRGFLALRGDMEIHTRAGDILPTSRPALESARFRSPINLGGTNTFFETEWVSAFYRDTSNQLRIARWNRDKWDAAVSPLGGTLASDPVVASFAVDRHDIFYRRTDGYLGQTFWSSAWPSWSTYQHEGPPITSDPAAVSWGGTRGVAGGHGSGRIDVVAVANGKLEHFWFDGSPASAQWRREQVPGSPAPTLRDAQRPAIVSSREGRIEVYVRGNDDTLWFVALNKSGSTNTWEAWKNLSTGMQSDAVAVAYAPGETLGFVRALDGNVYARGVSVESSIFPAGGWLRFDGCGGNFGQPGSVVGAPTVTAAAPGRVVVFARKSDNVLCRWDLTGLSSGAPNLSGVAWQLTVLNASAAADPVAVRSTRGTEVAFVGFNPPPNQGSHALTFLHWNEGSIMHPFEPNQPIAGPFCTFADERQCLWKPTGWVNP
jgi:hypothetical protein